MTRFSVDRWIVLDAFEQLLDDGPNAQVVEGSRVIVLEPASVYGGHGDLYDVARARGSAEAAPGIKTESVFTRARPLCIH